MPEVLPSQVTESRYRAVAAFLLRFLARVVLAIYVGGITFYAAVVVPDLHENLGGIETGEISRRVAIPLYAIGLSAIVLGWLVAATDRAERTGRRGIARIALLTSTTLLMVALIAMHRAIAGRIDAGQSRGEFFPLHERYLTVFGVQWLANLGLMALDATSGKFRETRIKPGPSE